MPRHTIPMALVKQGNKLSYALQRQLKKYIPSKSRITSDVESALKSGEGIRVREGILKKVAKKFASRNPTKSKRKSSKRRLNQRQAAVKLEIAARMRGRGFTSYASRIQALSKMGIGGGGFVRHTGRYGQELARAGLTVSATNSTLRMTWGEGTISEVGEAMSTPKADRATSDALVEVAKDIEAYISNEAIKAANKAFRS